MLVNIIAIDIFGRKRTALSLYLALALGSFAVLAWSSDAGPACRGRVCHCGPISICACAKIHATVAVIERARMKTGTLVKLQTMTRPRL